MATTPSLAKTLERIHKVSPHAAFDETEIGVVSTGFPNIDYVIGVPGLPRRKLTVLIGDPSTGKSSLCITFSAHAVMQDHKVLYLDFETSLERRHMERLGLTGTSSNFLAFQPTTMEEGFEIASSLMATGEIDLVVFDSVAAMMPAQVQSRDMGDMTPGYFSRALSSCLPILVRDARIHNVACLLTNQMRANISTGYGGGPSKIMAGGNALQYYAHVILRLHRKNVVKGPDGDEGMRLGLQARKNKVGLPGRETEFTFDYLQGVDQITAIAESLELFGLVEVGATGWIKDDELSISIRGRQNFEDMLRERPEILAPLVQRLLTYMENS